MAHIDVGIHPNPARITTERLTGPGSPDFSVIRLTGDGAKAVIFVTERPVLDALQRALNEIRDHFNASERAEIAPDAHLDDWSPGELMEAFGS